MGFLKDLKKATKEGMEKRDREREREQAEFMKRLQEAPDYKLEITVKGLESKSIDENSGE